MNITIMCIVFPAGLYLMSDWIMVGYQNLWIVLVQLVAVLLIDDFYFYCFHRLLHKSDFLFKKIHNIHHRARNPFPSDYLYEHPLEWLIGLLGPFIAFLILGGVSFPTIVLFLIIKVLHELDIHSGIKSSLYRHLPFAGINEYHALHHKYQDVHFASVFSLWDWVFRTNYLSKTAKK
ncbi:MAG: sterol desaturase family protein [Gammaproteobacteria bacterium]